MLKRPPRSDEPPDERVFGTHPGDVGVIIIAALLTFAWIALLVMPLPFDKMEQAQAAREKAERQKKIDQAVGTGEVSVGILPAKRH
jgi:hypothetical protein